MRTAHNSCAWRTLRVFMSDQDQEFRTRLLRAFNIEAQEHLNAMASLLLALENKSEEAKRQENLETLFREAHSLKGAARAVNFNDVENLCQALEGFLAALKRGELTLSTELFDLLHEAVDSLAVLLSTADRERSGEAANRMRELVQKLKSPQQTVTAGRARPAFVKESQPKEPEKLPPAEEPEPQPSGTAETVRIATAKLDSLLSQAEELLSAKALFDDLVDKLRSLNSMVGAWEKNYGKSAREASMWLRRLEKGKGPAGEALTLKRLLEPLSRGEIAVKALNSKSFRLLKTAEQDRRAFGGLVDNLQDEARRALMFPFSSLLEVFPTMARTLARDRGKSVDLQIQGAEIEVDRRILEEIKDPFIHLIRNAIDHGIETSEDRMRLNKPARGRITIAISAKTGNWIETAIADDGAGIDAAGVRDAALKRGLLSAENAENVNERELLSLIFESGLSTSAFVTDLSGRGLGLAIVREKVEKLGGSLWVETQRGIGTIFHLLLPLTLVTFRGLLVRVGEQLFVIPSSHVERSIRVSPEAIKTVENRQTVQLDGEPLALVPLSAVLELHKRGEPSIPYVQVVVLSFGAARIGFRVDEAVDEREVLVKKLGPPLLKVRNVSGATVLAGGRIVPILNVADLMKSAVRAGDTQSARAPEAKQEDKAVLVAEDSITARMLLKNILESAGYRVATAVDGMDALTQLRARRFDLVVSDVDMPMMNGFDLTAKIRGDRELAELPVVLVTALESRADRERGIDVGANAYIVKSSFDQSNLLEVIRRLL